MIHTQQRGDKRIFTGSYNAMVRAVRELMALSFDPAHFIRRNNTVSLAPRSTSDWFAYLPFWFTILGGDNEGKINVAAGVVTSHGPAADTAIAVAALTEEALTAAADDPSIVYIELDRVAGTGTLFVRLESLLPNYDADETKVVIKLYAFDYPVGGKVAIETIYRLGNIDILPLQAP